MISLPARSARSALVGYVLIAGALGNSALPPVCPYRRITGRGCPLCGTSRAVALALRGNWKQSTAAHPLGLPLAPLAIYELIRRTAGLSRRTSS